jgi:hypothetical protein
MFKALFRFQARFSTVQWSLIALTAVLLNFWATHELTTAYAASGFPVPYWQAQLSFDHLKLKGWYATLIEHGSLGLYLQAQYVDFLFIASVLVLHAAVLIVVARLHPMASRSSEIMLWAALLSAFAPIFDALENLVSFVMLSEPLSFEPALALDYSSLAAGKFAMFSFAYLAAPIGLVWALYIALRDLRGRSGDDSQTVRHPGSRPR